MSAAPSRLLEGFAHYRLQVRAAEQLQRPRSQEEIGPEDRFVMRVKRKNRLSSSCSAQARPRIYKKKAAAPGKTGRLPSSPNATALLAVLEMGAALKYSGVRHADRSEHA
jgi:hypothetical protein